MQADFLAQEIAARSLCEGTRHRLFPVFVAAPIAFLRDCAQSSGQINGRLRVGAAGRAVALFCRVGPPRTQRPWRCVSQEDRRFNMSVPTKSEDMPPSRIAGAVYEPAWERISDALVRVMQAGVPKNIAQEAICQAIADGAIKFRSQLKRHASKHMTSSTVLQDSSFEIPATIKPCDMDWETSRPVSRARQSGQCCVCENRVERGGSGCPRHRATNPGR